MFRALESAKIEMLADMTGQSSDALIGKLEGKGISNAETSMTIEEIASMNGKKEMDILWTIFE